MKARIIPAAVIALSILSAGCASEAEKASTTHSIEAHKDVNQAPVPLRIERIAEHEVNISMTAQITDIEIAKGFFCFLILSLGIDKYRRIW